MKPEYQLTYVSLGAGVQSSALLVCSALGLHGVPKADVAIFADTGDEPQYVYDYLNLLEKWSSIPIRRVSKGVLSEWITQRSREGKRFVTVPLYSRNHRHSAKGMLRRQCTREFKIEPITKEVRGILGLKPRQRAVGRVKVLAMLGISIDEADRMKPSREQWITNTWPLVDAGLTRRDCKRIITEAGLPVPGKSSCIYCPFHSDATWLEMKKDRPTEFAKAVAFDEQIRSMTMGGIKAPAYVHRSCQPLAEVDFESQREMDGFTAECEGVCGV